LLCTGAFKRTCDRQDRRVLTRKVDDRQGRQPGEMACCRASFDLYIRVVDSSFAARFVVGAVVGRARLTSRSCSKPELLIMARRKSR
jgi:hypothetical protein